MEKYLTLKSVYVDYKGEVLSTDDNPIVKSNTKDKDSRQSFFSINLLIEGVELRCKDFSVRSYFSLISLFSDTGTKIG